MELIETLYNRILEKPLAILNIFNEFFGEELVDLQGFKTLEETKSYFSGDIAATESSVSTYVGNEGFILVHFPHVTITNEHNKSVEINHLWAKVYILLDGRMTGRFLLNRSDYTVLHFYNQYMHSHILRIPMDNFEQFQTPCTGRGPINNTIGSLNANYDADLWNLFCLELSRYVTVESLAGIPYHKLESLVTLGSYVVPALLCPVREVTSRQRTVFSYRQIAAFTVYLVKNTEIPFNYINGCYSIAELPVDFILRISDLFTDWYNSMFEKGYVTASRDDLIAKEIIVPYILSNNQFYKNSFLNNISRYTNFIGQKVCTFKGKDITVNISDASNENLHSIYVLNFRIISYILTKILNTINYRYGREEGSEGISSDQEIRYI